MKILVIGGTGVIGSSVVFQLKNENHQVVVAGSKSGDILLDITNEDSIREAFAQTPDLDAVVITSGKVHFGELAKATSKDFYLGINNKLMGQINTVLIGMQYVKPQASFTLTSGILNQDPIYLGTNAALVNGALEGFVKGASIEMPTKMRINLVSPTVVCEAMDKYADFFKGYKPVAASEVALAYLKSIFGHQTGQVYKVGFI